MTTDRPSQLISRRGVLAAAGASVAAGGWWLLGSPASTDEATGGNPFVPDDLDERSWIIASGFMPRETTVGLGDPVDLEMQLRNNGGEDGTLQRTAHIQSIDENDVVHHYDHSEVEVDVPAESTVEASVTLDAPLYVDDFTAVLPGVWFSYDLMGDLTSTIKVRP